MRCRNASVAIDEKRSRQRIDAAVQLGDLLGSDQDAVVDFSALDIGLHGGPSVVVQRYAEHGELAILVILLKIHEPGDFDLAGTAPGGPEVQQHDLAAEVGK